MIAPAGVIRPILLLFASVNQRLPSGPAAISCGMFSVVLSLGNSVIAPAGVIRPILLSKVSVNQRLPSGPAAIACGCASALSGNSVIETACAVAQQAPNAIAAVPVATTPNDEWQTLPQANTTTQTTHTDPPARQSQPRVHGEMGKPIGRQVSLQESAGQRPSNSTLLLLVFGVHVADRVTPRDTARGSLADGRLASSSARTGVCDRALGPVRSPVRAREREPS